MIKLTESAVGRIREIVAREKHAMGLRLSVTHSGCSGYSYVLNIAETIVKDDTLIKQDGVTVVIDSASLPILDNLILDFIKDGLNENFKFNNPNAVSSCGCGESFSIIK